MTGYAPISGSSGCTSSDSNSGVFGNVNHHFAAIGFRVVVATVAHPLEYAKTLIQLGHEPLSPRHTKTLMGRPALALPSVFMYMSHIRKRDGWLGLYKGLGPKILALGLNAVVTDKVSAHLKVEYGENEDNLTEEQKRQRVIDTAIKDMAERLACLIVTQPLHVITVRSMAQFIGGEEVYNGVFSGIVEVYRQNGLMGFWSGLIPRALGEIFTVAITASVTYFVNKYVVDDNKLQSYTSHVASFFASSLCYPFAVVSNCTCVSRSGLAAGYPPNMPFYSNWLDCWKHLSKEKQLKRGSSLLFRYYTGPQVIVGDRAIPVNKGMFSRVQ